MIMIRSDEGLTLETSAFRISVRWQIYIINSVDKTKFLYTTSPPTQHHSFFRNYPFIQFHYMPVKCFIYSLPEYLSSALERVQKRAMRIIYMATMYHTLMLLRPQILIVYRKEDLNCVRVFFNKPFLILTISYFTYYHLTLIILQ